MALWGLGTQWKKRHTGADTSAVRVISAASSLLALPLHCFLYVSKEQAAAWVSLVPAAESHSTPLLQAPGDPFHHSAIGLVTLAEWQKVCRAKMWLWLGAGCHC